LEYTDVLSFTHALIDGVFSVFTSDGGLKTRTSPCLFLLLRDSKKMPQRRLRLKTVRRSHKPEKKWDAVFITETGREKVVPFGAAGMSNYTKHKNATRKQRYIRRHSGMGESWNKPDTPGALSRWILWNKKGFRESVADFKRRFRV
jgi:hypothetical protein